MFVTVPLCMIPGVILWFTPVNVFICFLFCFTLLSCECFFRMCVLHTYVFYECMYTCMHVRRCVFVRPCACVYHACELTQYVCVCMYVYIYISLYVTFTYVYTYIYIYVLYLCMNLCVYTCNYARMCIRTHTHTYIYIYICPVVYVVRLVLFSSIILLANRSSRNIFLLRSITSQRRQKNVPYFEKLQHLELFIQYCSSPVQPRQISLHNVLQGTSRHL